LPDLLAAARRFGRGQQAGAAGVSIDDLVLPEHARREVGRLLDWTRYRDEVMAQGTLQGKGGKGTGICALFAGGPGTGKTLAAHVVADAMGIGLLRVELSSVISKYIGESEKNLERIFVEAESLNCVLFFDEADALFGARSGTKDAHDRYANQEVSYLLQRMESFDGITILATNLRGNLDPAFARRLHFIITFPDPDAATRSRLWQHHLAAVRTLDDADPIDAELLAQAAEVSGGDIRNVVLASVYDAVARSEPVGMRHIASALSRELGKLGRRVPDISWLTNNDTSDATGYKVLTGKERRKA
jgi:SpoVK/Ycf46/Vps4 family AAA+-type ATPase